MKTINLPSAVLLAHESARTLPEHRRVEHDYYSLIDANVGSTIEDFDSRIEQCRVLIGSEDTDAQLNAHNHLRFLFFNLLNREYSARSLAFSCLIESIDGVAWTDYSPKGVERLSLTLSDKGLTDELIWEHWPDLKKKFIPS